MVRVRRVSAMTTVPARSGTWSSTGVNQVTSLPELSFHCGQRLAPVLALGKRGRHNGRHGSLTRSCDLDNQMINQRLCLPYVGDRL